MATESEEPAGVAAGRIGILDARLGVVVKMYREIKQK